MRPGLRARDSFMWGIRRGWRCAAALRRRRGWRCAAALRRTTATDGTGATGPGATPEDAAGRLLAALAGRLGREPTRDEADWTILAFDEGRQHQAGPGAFVGFTELPREAAEEDER
jgi:hypothetical protein